MKWYQLTNKNNQNDERFFFNVMLPSRILPISIDAVDEAKRRVVGDEMA